jgi:hypothetical protein
MNDIIEPGAAADSAAHPSGEYAIVELFGHVTLVGRIAEVERFGSKMLAIEPLFRGEMLPMVFYGGGSIYGLTPCSAEIAFNRAPENEFSLPASLRAALPPKALPHYEDAQEYPEDAQF